MTMLRILFSALLLFPISTAVFAQSGPAFPAPASMPQFRRVDPVEDIAAAQQLERAGRIEEAVKRYERVLRLEPLNPQALSALPRLYTRLQQYDKAVALLRKQVARDPKNITYRRMLADALFRANRPDEARAQCERILAIDGARDRGIRISAALYTQYGYLDDAVGAYLQGRKRLHIPGAYALELARLYALLSDGRHATEEYLRWVMLQPGQFAAVDERIEALAGEGGPEPVEAALEEAVANTPSRVEPRKLLGNFYLRRGQPIKALEQYRIVDRLNGDTGAALLEFAAWCEREQFYPEAIGAYREVGARPLPRHVLARAAFGAARAMQALVKARPPVRAEAPGRFDEVLVAYQQVVTRFPRTWESEEAMYRIASLQLTHYHKPQTALTAYRTLLAAAPRTRRRVDILFRIADCHVARGSIRDAVAQYTAILNSRKSGLSGDKVQERARYRLAEMTLFQGDIDAASKQFNEVAELFPGGDYANDALEWSLLIDEAKQAAAALNAYAQTVLLRRQYREQDALDACKKYLNSYPGSPISDLVVLDIGAILDGLGKPYEAIAAYRDMLERFPKSRRASEAQRRIAEVYERRLQDIPKAVAEYETLLVKYPDGLYNDAVRRRIRSLTRRHPPQP